MVVWISTVSRRLIMPRRLSLRTGELLNETRLEWLPLKRLLLTVCSSRRSARGLIDAWRSRSGGSIR